MADAVVNYQVEIQRLRAQIAQQTATIEAQRLAIMEMQDRKVRHEANIAAAELAIETYKEQLAGLKNTHGTK